MHRSNCPGATALYAASGKSPRWLSGFLREHAPHNATALHALTALGGGYDWTCGTFSALPKYFARADVRAALNLPAKSETSLFLYDSSGPASITLYPALLQKLRVLIYNGDAECARAPLAHLLLRAPARQPAVLLAPYPESGPSTRPLASCGHRPT